MSIFESVRDLVVVNSDHHALKLSIALRDGPVGDVNKAYAGNAEAGHFYLYRNESVPGMVMETVFSPKHKDGITSVYQEHRIFESGSELLRKRAALVAALAAEYGLPHESIGIDDAARGRQMALTELSTGQLIDLLQDRARGGIVTMKTDNYATGVDKALA
ncbi:hypothetical protein GFK26_18130 [Variovorax paradoxus]|uniref:Uncharacterized protein n=1 Tax=Variovorax paradoxus TaxID=34073 RepID=A0A5Q0M6W5_VARPD|nr:hypothetical protein [Variovorax paradoxus]QFZ84547.1 hypothetical protein GFK26_18130 [Variovorax paradoxus]